MGRKSAKIAVKKGAADKARGQVYTRALKDVFKASKGGSPDPAANFLLKVAIERCKSFNVPKDNVEKAIKKGGEIIHEVGTTRMGASAKDSVTNQYGQTWDCDNLFVMDGGVFASSPHKNCTLTIMTLAMRNATWLASQLDKGVI